ncbi:MAG: ATP-binding protein [Bacteroidales bacterium]|nr:ATP-binding protein [Bacteroidales bacterium]
MHKVFYAILLLVILTIQAKAQINNSIDSLLQQAQNFAEGNPNKSIDNAISALELARQNDYHEKKVEAYILIAKYHLHKHNPSEALDSLYSAVPSINEIPTSMANQLLATIGQAHMAAHNDTVSFITAIGEEETIAQNKKYGELLLILIDYYINNNNLKKAAEFIKRASLIADQVNDKQLIYSVLQKRGIAQYELNYLSRALKSFEQTADFFTTQNDKLKLAEAQRYIAEIHYKKSDYKQAINYFYASLNNDSSSVHQPVILKSMAKIKLINEQYDESIELLKTALNREAKTERSELFYLLAGNYYMKLDIESSKQYYDSAIYHAKSIHNSEMLGKALAAKAKCYSYESDYKTASFYLKNAYEASENSYEEKIVESIEKQNAYYSNLYQSSQINNLRQEHEWHELQLKHSKTQNILLLTILIASLGGLLLLVFFFLQNKQFNRKLKEKNNLIDQSNNELQTINNALTDSQLSLLKSNQVKDRMFSIITHDVKGALISLRAQMETKSNECSAGGIQSINSTIGLLNQHIKWAVAQTEKPTVRKETFALNEVINSSIKLFAGAINKKNIQLEKNDNNTYQIVSDRKVIELIFRNLLSNAIKYSPSNGTVKLNIHQTDQSITITVDDNGPGINKSALQTIFTSPQNEKESGSGLYLSYKFAMVINAKLSVKNKDNMGCIFTFEIPL